MTKRTNLLIWVGIILIVLTGLIHFVDAPDSFDEATYKGVLFLANGAGALLAAAGIWAGKRWGWTLGLLVAVGALAGYVASRTVGMPGIPAEPDAWFEPLGIASLVAEGLFSLVALSSLRAANVPAQPPRAA